LFCVNFRPASEIKSELKSSQGYLGNSTWAVIDFPKMSRKDIDKRLRKIEKGEEKALKILSKQRKELLRALEENEKMIGQRLNKGTPAELKVEAEIEKLTQVKIILFPFNYSFF
jgi:low affinity Fe/Cu permease